MYLIFYADQCGQCCANGEATGHQEDTPAGRINNYLTCFLLPPAATHIYITFMKLSLGDTLYSDMASNVNKQYLTDVNHIEVLNGEKPLFSCSDVKLGAGHQMSLPKMEVTSLENTIIFNLTVGDGNSELDPWYHLHFNGK